MVFGPSQLVGIGSLLHQHRSLFLRRYQQLHLHRYLSIYQLVVKRIYKFASAKHILMATIQELFFPHLKQNDH